MNAATLEWISVVGPLLVSWPVAALSIALLFRRPILRLVERLLASEQGRAEIGPVKLELGRLAQEGHQAVARLNRLNVVMAESRRLELEITSGMFGSVFSEGQRAEMHAQIQELRSLTDSPSEV